MLLHWWALLWVLPMIAAVVVVAVVVVCQRLLLPPGLVLSLFLLDGERIRIVIAVMRDALALPHRSIGAPKHDTHYYYELNTSYLYAVWVCSPLSPASILGCCVLYGDCWMTRSKCQHHQNE